MPNIEIHGIGIRGAYVDDGMNLELKIFEIFSGKTYISEMVVTTFDDAVQDAHHLRQPFLRVVSTPSPHLDEIVELLKALNIDIEVLMLSAFYPKKSASAG